MRQIARLASYRLRATFAERRSALVSIVLLVGLVGGIAMGAIAGARRTDSSYPVFVASTNPSTVQVLAGFLDPQLGLREGYNAKVLHDIARLPQVAHSVTTVGFDGTIDLNSLKGVHLHEVPGETPPSIIGGLGGEYLTQDRLTVTAGRLFDPKRAIEALMNAQAAAQLGLHVGSVVSFPIYTDAENVSPTYNGPPYRVVRIRIVGEAVFGSSVVQSDIERLGDSRLLLSPALTAQLAPCCAYYSGTAMVLKGGVASSEAVLHEASRVTPVAGAGLTGMNGKGAVIGEAQRAIQPEAIALGVFGAIAGLAVLLIAGQLMGRLLRRNVGDASTLRALGASRVMAFSDVLGGLLASVLLGSMLAAGLAVGISPLMPLGPVRPVYPASGVSADWTVLGLGTVALMGVLAALAMVLARREAALLSSGRRRASPRLEGFVSRTAANSGLSLAAVTGLRFAVERGESRDAAPVRSAILGATLAVTVLVATLTFGTSLNSLVSHPALYGWNWDYAMLSGFAGKEDLPEQAVTAQFNRDRDVLAWSGANIVGSTTLDGQRVMTLAEHPGASVAPPLLSGHGLEQPNQVVLGPTTLAGLGKHVGDTLTLQTQGGARVLTIVGTATFPAIASGFQMGSGALVATSDFPAAILNPQQNTYAGPNAVLIRLRPGLSARDAQRSLLGLQSRINATKGDEGSVGGLVRLLRPAEIVNYRSMGTTPAVLGLGLAVGAIAALGLTLVASVRRRRRDLAMLKTLGFSRRQLASSIAWQSSVAVLIGIAIGVPMGIVLGRSLWDLFAHEINAVPAPSVSVPSLALVAVGAFVLANLVATVPGNMAARTPTALILRSE